MQRIAALSDVENETCLGTLGVSDWVLLGEI